MDEIRSRLKKRFSAQEPSVEQKEHPDLDRCSTRPLPQYTPIANPFPMKTVADTMKEVLTKKGFDQLLLHMKPLPEENTVTLTPEILPMPSQEALEDAHVPDVSQSCHHEISVHRSSSPIIPVEQPAPRKRLEQYAVKMAEMETLSRSKQMDLLNLAKRLDNMKSRLDREKRKRK